ncbi:fumarylacetoacetate hydrolase family protein [Maritimibacter sp. UBA3975]|uniref:fumarylacetoacetate hydrolase family protein n=1 Tax=Maritimibacter sp. UBA3975 TaxID=1946833 RepID=UPI000C09913A|nr:fumarylacetoacetate hydrolase family protein [Maritimibacter sp. UBA3975]MAM63566.1 hypothetical protein [Maritimibacter sp.]|tara:strand:- start:39118 stop:39969 length:852 start_codon:yes stop_codon:yes gene_type:complete
MRFLSYIDNGKRGLAVKTEDGFRGLLDDTAGYPGSLDDIVRSGDFAGAARALEAGDLIDAEAVMADLPFHRAAKLLCVGLNYADHAQETRMEVPPFPTVFVRFNGNCVPHGGNLVKPDASDQFDYEGELVAVIGKRGRAISRADALDHVAGYTIFNDGSIRDYQMQTNQWTIGKNFDSTGAMGPYFVTSDELPAGAKGLKVSTRLNGATLQDGSTDDMIFDVADLVSKLSLGMTLEPGDLIVTGTPAGVGMGRDPQVYMKPGDVCEVEVEGIGVLRNAVVSEN